MPVSFKLSGNLISVETASQILILLMKPIIRVENLSKMYSIGGRQRYLTFRESLIELVQSPFKTFKRTEKDKSVFWALKDVNFEVMPGEVLGIIGRNGAGKSTLLKIISRISEPTTGRVELYGRVGSLLEVGTGFHPELTGRENIFLNGAILGMKRYEVARKFDDIVDFAQIEKFLDTAVKYYSSGMYMRLAFAVAANLEPEVLIVDEVLAVGDDEFQKKCLAKIKSFSGEEGRTVLFVSHNISAIQSLCSKVALFREGKIANLGKPKTVIDEYLNTDSHYRLEQLWENKNEAPGNQAVRLKHAKIIPQIDNKTFDITKETPIDIKFEFWNLLEGMSYLSLVLVLWTNSGKFVFKASTPSVNLNAGLCQAVLHIPPYLLSEDKYSVELYFVKDASNILFKHNDIVSFEVSDIRYNIHWNAIGGTISPSLKFILSHL